MLWNMHGRSISIWFFIGITLLVYGILIAGVGVMHLSSPPAQPTVLSELHADLWWGLVMLALGGYYSWKFRPAAK
jgi:hypothetical protein